jgi:purine-nucleoside phosphorylase
MSIHIGAKEGEIAECVLLPGDPKRAHYVATKFLDSPECYNQIRGMSGYTGKAGDLAVSVQGTGMGMPSSAIYINELIQEFKAKKLIRIGTCGALQPELKIGDLIIAQGASTDSAMNKLVFSGQDFAPVASFSLLERAVQAARNMKLSAHIGGVVSCDSFYAYDQENWKLWAEHGVLGMEMEANALYTLAARHKVEALAILTVSDSLVSGHHASNKERETQVDNMTQIALAALGDTRDF